MSSELARPFARWGLKFPHRGKITAGLSQFLFAVAGAMVRHRFRTVLF